MDTRAYFCWLSGKLMILCAYMAQLSISIIQTICGVSGMLTDIEERCTLSKIRHKNSAFVFGFTVAWVWFWCKCVLEGGCLSMFRPLTHTILYNIYTLIAEGDLVSIAAVTMSYFSNWDEHHYRNRDRYWKKKWNETKKAEKKVQRKRQKKDTTYVSSIQTEQKREKQQTECQDKS